MGFLIVSQIAKDLEVACRVHGGSVISARFVLPQRATTPAVLPLIHGWGGLQDELTSPSKQGKWVEMRGLIDDEILNTFAVVGGPEHIAPDLHRRYGDVIQRISFDAPYTSDPVRWQKVMTDLHAA